jgi:xylan 1,4-beta-xylosidase
MGSPQWPTEEQYAQLKHAGQLQLLTSPAWLPVVQGAAHLQFTLPRQGLSLIRMTRE